MDRSTKETIVGDLTERFGRAKSLTFTEFKGLSVAHANQLRGKCREAGVEYLVVKNTLIHLALPEAVRDEIKPHLVGTTAVTLDYEEGVVGPKTLSDFAKDHPAIILKAGLLEGKALNA
ncbi:MAG: 50S ribosomal protein L10, partial [Candidatus Omnitrophica bacterium]|nr:50S ribosomal protein L10 [Candidatus Omnitrophota bacterium]